ncbi:g2179 [Coccomyxa viridis]|uniref:G2179 protein n=1 Tax=Coccomyxa viridis TaxID=1274662 RepID=A0ABP1FJR2_9CHLO
MSALDRMEGWEQINGAELYKGQRPALNQKKYATPPDVGAADSSVGAQQIKYVNPAMEPIEKVPQPSAPLVVSQDWETIDKDESWDKQASAPELPAGIQTPPQTTTARSAAYSAGEPPAVQMQGLEALQRDAEGPYQDSSSAEPDHVQATHVLPESSPAPRSCSPAERQPRVLRKLQAGDRLAAGDKLESSNGLSNAILQHDGNFVVYTRKNLLTSASKAAWSTGTYEGNRKHPLRGHELCAQEDGNLVLYTVDRKVAWASNTDNRNSDAYTLEVTDSGALVWYCETNGEEVWSSRH